MHIQCWMGLVRKEEREGGGSWQFASERWLEEVVEGGIRYFLSSLFVCSPAFRAIEWNIHKGGCGVGNVCSEECAQFGCIIVREQFTKYLFYYVDAKRKRNAIKESNSRIQRCCCLRARTSLWTDIWRKLLNNKEIEEKQFMIDSGAIFLTRNLQNVPRPSSMI